VVVQGPVLQPGCHGLCGRVATIREQYACRSVSVQVFLRSPVQYVASQQSDAEWHNVFAFFSCFLIIPRMLL